ncbi:hypothetical protein [Pseudactinotalea suaedae]|uniref:hypothetical protein n=1 Tax=Pseudactinotalea suaedae TaxID=1524924 RepID=UPI0012E27835|nr:hypothetical protein [Pseudactinotalea suaedae]
MSTPLELIEDDQAPEVAAVPAEQIPPFPEELIEGVADDPDAPDLDELDRADAETR